MSKEEVAKIPQGKRTTDEIAVTHCYTIPSLLSEIKEAIEIYGEDNIRFDVYTKYYPYEASGTLTASLICQRFNTEEEQAKVDEELAQQKKTREEWDKREFERLSKVFGAK